MPSIRHASVDRYAPVSAKGATPLLAPLTFRAEERSARRQYMEDTHPWGELVYSYSGVTEVRVGARQFLAPPFMGIWIPPGITHTGFIHAPASTTREAAHASLYVDAGLCTAMPDQVRTVRVSALLRALLEHLRRQTRKPVPATDAAHQRMLHVVLDLLSGSETAGSYIPTASDPVLVQVLEALRANPADARPAQQIARQHGVSERTLTRRCREELGMSLNAWRQRARVASALELLNSGHTVEACALQLGYSTASAFIAMFKKLMGASPRRYARG